MRCCGRKIEPVAMGAIPAQFGDAPGGEKKKSKRLYIIQFVPVEKIIGVRPVEKIEQHQPPATAVRRLMLVFYECSVEQTGHTATAGSRHPSAAGFGVFGKNQPVSPSVFPRNQVG